MAAVRMFWEPCVCWVQPSAYMIVIDFSPLAVDETMSQTFRNFSFGDPQMRSTISGV